MSSSPQPASATRPGATVVLIFLALSYALSYFDRMLMVVLGETIKGEFHLSDKQLSLLTGVTFAVLYGVVGISAGWLADRSNRKRLMIGSLALWSLATMACGLAQSFAQLALGRLAVGVGEATTVPAGLSLISDAYPREKRPMATGIFIAGSMVGLIASFVIGGWIAGHFGWRAAFLAGGPPGLIVAILIAIFLREPPRAPPELGEVESTRGSFALVFRNPAARWMIVAHAFATFANSGMITWLPMFFIRSHHMSVTQIGLFFGPVLGTGTLVGMLAGGWIGDRFAAKSLQAMVWFCIAGVAVVSPLYLILLSSPLLSVGLALTFVCAFTSVIFIPTSLATYQTLCDPKARGTAGGLGGFVAMLVGAGLFPYVVGAFSDAWKLAEGAESLRYALMASQGFAVLTIGLYLRAAYHIKRGRVIAEG